MATEAELGPVGWVRAWGAGRVGLYIRVLYHCVMLELIVAFISDETGLSLKPLKHFLSRGLFYLWWTAVADQEQQGAAHQHSKLNARFTFQLKYELVNERDAADVSPHEHGGLGGWRGGGGDKTEEEAQPSVTLSPVETTMGDLRLYRLEEVHIRVL